MKQQIGRPILPFSEFTSEIVFMLLLQHHPYERDDILEKEYHKYGFTANLPIISIREAKLVNPRVFEGRNANPKWLCSQKNQITTGKGRDWNEGTNQ